jgi:hypothetical protein
LFYRVSISRTIHLHYTHSVLQQKQAQRVFNDSSLLSVPFGLESRSSFLVSLSQRKEDVTNGQGYTGARLPKCAHSTWGYGFIGLREPAELSRLWFEGTPTCAEHVFQQLPLVPAHSTRLLIAAIGTAVKIPCGGWRLAIPLGISFCFHVHVARLSSILSFLKG